MSAVATCNFHFLISKSKGRYSTLDVVRRQMCSYSTYFIIPILVDFSIYHWNAERFLIASILLQKELHPPLLETRLGITSIVNKEFNQRQY